jgi:phosphotransferase system HPr (HPr) family protein
MPQECQRRSVTVSNPQGMHARPAELFARLALTFDSEIEVLRDGHRVDAKSILNILTLGAVQGTELILEARGDDASVAVDSLAKLVESGFSSDHLISQEGSG